MSDVDFEAIGRCEHLRSQISAAMSARNVEASRISHATRDSGGSFFQERIRIIDLDAIDAQLISLKQHDAHLRELVNEYNSWATKAGKSEIVYIKY
ncbi:hypothetical protein SAMN05216563_1316 [Phytobacter palmae]|nr:hypothetical protein SAMN05216563_1316 [Phytobacter palmae]